MKTEISQFCSEFSGVLTPLDGALSGAIEGLERISSGPSLGAVPPGLADVRHRLKALIDKVEGQEAYVLIFGPLKSGKSTLINAISAAYVSEVTTLPAYPCMVYVKHSERTRFSVLRYNGQEQTLTDPAELRDLIDQGHHVLAERIRSVEQSGGDFDPAVDCPEAIRRVIVELPAPDLIESGTVLVDTPGLYSRMKFGYDLMTREFRNSAACALFVVKTDNLFLEQVFADFNDLLDLFSRIFVVVNLDTTKRDLGPDGSLTPSLESQDPARIIEAFESLTMSAPLRQAADTGRLRIYPIDLLTAAANRLRERRSVSEPGAGEFEPAASDEHTGVDGRFDAFLQDLTEYLNSTDYLVEFIDDSLRRGTGLCGEIRGHLDSEAIRENLRRQEALEARLREKADQLAAVADLEKVDWSDALTKVRREHAESTRTSARALGEPLSSRLLEALDRWFESDDSLAGLGRQYLNPILQASAAKTDSLAESRLRFLTDTPLAGADLPANAAELLEKIGLSLQPICRAAIDSISPRCEAAYAIRIDPEQVPVKKRFFDYILLRRRSTVRRKLLGPPESPDLAVPAKVKERRLGQAGKDALKSMIETHLGTVLLSASQQSADQLMRQYVASFCGGVSDALADARRRLDDEYQATQHELEAYRQVASLVEQLGAVVTGVVESVERLTDRYTPERGEAAESPAQVEPESDEPVEPHSEGDGFSVSSPAAEQVQESSAD